MEELKKVQRVIGKNMPGAPHEILLVLDATTGQNAVMQAREFCQTVAVSGLVLTKLDGTSKGWYHRQHCSGAGYSNQTYRYW